MPAERLRTNVLSPLPLAISAITGVSRGFPCTELDTITRGRCLTDGMQKSTHTLPQCPRCTSTAVRRSHRKGIERLLSLLGIYPFRCENCSYRFKRLAGGIGRRWHPHIRSSLLALPLAYAGGRRKSKKTEPPCGVSPGTTT